MPESTRRFRFGAAQRLTGQGAFDRVLAGRRSRTIDGLMIAAVPSAVGRHRLGVNVPKRIGHSVARHHLRRRLREAFRLTRKDLPGAYDIVIVVRALPLPGADLGAMLAEALAKLDLIWRAESRV